MKKRMLCLALAILLVLAAGCSHNTTEETTATTAAPTTTATTVVTTTETTTQPPTIPADDVPITQLGASTTISSVTSGIKIALFTGDDALSSFLSDGGASTDEELTTFLVKSVLLGKAGFKFSLSGFGCSTMSVKGADSKQYFGRNFDWKTCNAMILVNRPESGYSSVSTVNMDFITASSQFDLTDDMKRFVALYCPLDGMNSKGVCISVNMIPGSAKINQNNGRTDITTTTAIRLVLDRASSAREAVNLLKSYDMHSSFGYNIHFAICDSTGYSVAVEYINNRMVVTETPVLTNFYVAGENFGTGSQSSIERYDALMDLLDKNETMNASQVREAMKSVGKKYYNDPIYSSTEWTCVFDQTSRTVTYFHRENFSKGYRVAL